MFVKFRYLNDRLSGKELLIRFTARAFRKLLSMYVLSYFPYGFEGRTWALIVSVSDHCLSFYFADIKDRHEVLDVFKLWPDRNIYFGITCP